MIKKIANQYDLKEVFKFLESKKGDFIGYDVETTGLMPYTSKVILVQIGDQSRQYVLDVARLNTPGRSGIKEVLNLINELDIKCIAHNAVFDYKMTKADFGIEIKNILCTMLAAQLLAQGLQSNIPMSLAHTLERFIGVKMEKEVRETFIGFNYGDEFTDEQIEYSGLDVAHLIKLKDILLGKLQKLNLLNIAVLEFNTIKVTGDMELNGALIDTKLWTALEKVALDEAEIIRKELDKMFAPYVGETDIFGDIVINYGSPVQMKKYLSEALGYQIESTAEKVISKIDKPIVKKLLAFRKQLKLSGTYGSEFIRQNIQPDGRIRSSFHQLGTSTGRYASRNPNFTNIPRDPRYRRPFISSPGYKFISADFSGQELRLLAHLSQEPEMIKALKEKKDLHAYSASLIYKIPYEDFFEYEDEARTIIKLEPDGSPVFIDKMKKLRNATKALVFGILYGMGPNKLADKLGITIDEARDIIRKYFEIFPKVKTLMDKLAADVIKNKYAYSPLDGRKMFFWDLDWNHKGKVAHAQRQGQNFPFQGTGATTTKQALIYIDEKIKELKFDAQILFAVHDKLLS